LNKEFVDFHTHLDWYDDENVLLNQLSTYKGIIVSASVNLESYEKNKQISQKANALGYGVKIIPTVGIHPNEVSKAPENLSCYNEACRQSPIIGEIGMDFFWYKDASPDNQERVFRYFLEKCDEMGKFCVIHTKGAEQNICRILEEYKNARPIIHWYDGPSDVFQEFNKRGYYETFGCEILRSKKMQEFLKTTPKDLILAETDNPTSEPWLGGTDNSVHLIERIYSDISNTMNLSIEETLELINSNSNKILSKTIFSHK